MDRSVKRFLATVCILVVAIIFWSTPKIYGEGGPDLTRSEKVLAISGYIILEGEPDGGFTTIKIQFPRFSITAKVDTQAEGNERLYVRVFTKGLNVTRVWEVGRTEEDDRYYVVAPRVLSEVGEVRTRDLSWTLDFLLFYFGL